MFNDYFRGKVYRFILRSSFAYPSLIVRLSFAQGSVGLVEGSSCPKSFVL